MSHTDSRWRTTDNKNLAFAFIIETIMILMTYVQEY